MVLIQRLSISFVSNMICGAWIHMGSVIKFPLEFRFQFNVFHWSAALLSAVVCHGTERWKKTVCFIHVYLMY